MKQESTPKKSKKLIWLIAAVVVLLAVAGVVAAVFLMKPAEQAEQQAGPTGPVGGRPDLYWNLDRQLYLGNEESAGLSTREPAEDGLYHIRFAYNGEVVEYTFADKRLVNVIDNMDVCGLIKDADGNVIDCVDASKIATEIAKSFFVMRNKDGKITLNSSIAMNGMELPVPLCELTQIYDVRQNAENPGAIAEVEMMDKVIAYSNDKGETTHVYIIDRQPEADVYWRVDKMYDSTNKVSTRVPDEDGVYHIKFAIDGKHVELKTKDKALVDDIDTKGAAYNAPKGLVVDNDGFIVKQVDPVIALRGKLAGSEYHVTELNGNQMTATCLLAGAKENGKSFTVTIPDDCPIYNVCVGGSATMIGEPTQLQMYDRVICYTDLDGKPILIYVMYRMANVPMYWNITRQYNSTKAETARVPNASGYYVFDMTVEGKRVTLRTKDKALASKIDSYTWNMVGLEVEGDIIKRAYSAVYVSGNDIYGAGGQRIVVEQIGVILSFVNTSTATLATPTNLVVKPDVVAYDVTGYPGTTIGEPTTYNPGDTLRIVTDYNNNITHIFVIARYTGADVFYNFARKYNESKAETTRVPDAEGYYVFDMATKGKHVTVKTKDKKIASIIDMQNAPIVALDYKVLDDGTYLATAAYEAVTSRKFGYKAANYRRFMEMNADGTMSTMIESTGVIDKWKVADDVVIYNCSDVYSTNKGEKVKSLQYWDQIQGIATKEDGTIKEIYIMKRQAESEFYYNGHRQYNSTTGKTTRAKDADGYYVYSLLVNGEEKTFKTKSDEIANTVDSFNYVPFGMKVKGDIIEAAFAATSIKGVKNTPASNYDITKISKTSMTVTRYLPTYTNVGASVELKLSPKLKAWNVSGYAPKYGAEIKLELGDRLICYNNMDGEVQWAFVWYENTHQKGHISYCEHCGKNVYWQPYVGGSTASYSANGVDVHLYVTDSKVKRGQTNHGVKGMPESDRTEVVLDLNGQTLHTSSARNFLVYGTMSIVDTVGGGKIEGGTKTSTGNGSAIMLGEGGILNLYAGTLTEHPENNTNANGGVLYVGTGSTVNMYGGTIEGGSAKNSGSNVYMVGGEFNMYGGTIDGGFYVTTKAAKINIGGKSTIKANDEGGLILPQGFELPLDKVTADTKVKVDAQGVFTKEYDNVSQYLANFSASAPEFEVKVAGKALSAGLQAHCPHCDQDVYWSKFSGKAANGHYIVLEDMVMNEQLQLGTTSVHTMDMVVDLNGHTIETTGSGEGSSTGRFALVYAGLSIMDSSAAQTGKIVATRNSPTMNAGLILASTGAKVNLYGGELTAADGVTFGVGGIVNQGSGTFKMYGGKITNGTVVGTVRTDKAEPYSRGGTGGNLYIGSSATAYIYGGEISGGKAYASVIEEEGPDGGITYTIGKAENKKDEILGYGGNIYSAGKLYIGTEDGTTPVITNGTATYGGNIYAASSFTTYKNSLISNGVAEKAYSGHQKYYGGNIYLSTGRATIYGVVENGTAFSGGNIGVTGSTRVVLDGAQVLNGNAASWAGGNYYGNNGIVEMKNGAVVKDGTAYGNGGNMYLASGAELHMTDSTISGGTTNGSTATGGGSIYLAGREDSTSASGYDYAILNATNSTITGGTLKNKVGGNIYANTAKITLNDSTLSNGTAEKSAGGNIYAGIRTTVTLVDSTVSGGTSGTSSGGNIYAENAAVVTLTGSTVKDGSAATSGGNVCITSAGTTFTMDANSELKNGRTTQYVNDSTWNGGGNINIGTGSVATISGKVTDGLAQHYGGNILVSNADVTLTDGALISGGQSQLTGTAAGGNICKWNAGTLDIQAGAVVTGGTNKDGENTTIYTNNATNKTDNAYLNIAGTVDGLLRVNDVDVNVTVSGAAKISNMLLAKNCKINLGELTTGAEIKVNAPGVFTNDNDNAANYVQYFDAVEEGKGVAVQGKALIVGTALACAHCDGEEAVFVPFTGVESTTGHYIVENSLTMNTQIQIGTSTKHDDDVVVELNGKTVTSKGRFALSYGKLSIQDSVGGGVITTSRTGDTGLSGGLLLASTGSVTNLYSGTLTVPAGMTAGKGGVLNQGSGTFNMYGGTISGGKAVPSWNDTKKAWDNGIGGNIYSGGATINIYGGTISGGVAEAKVVYTAADGTTAAKTEAFCGQGGNIYSLGPINIGKVDGDVIATVTGGKAYQGGNIYAAGRAAAKDLTVNKKGVVTLGEAIVAEDADGHKVYANNGGNIYSAVKTTINGTVSEGKAANGGNIYTEYVASVSTIYISGNVTKGQATVNGGNLYLLNVTNINGGASITDGKAAGEGGNLYHTGTFNIGGADQTEKVIISGGEAARGGNIRMVKTMNAYKNVEISGGKATTDNGGNIYAHCDANSITINLDGAVVKNGVATISGGNIYLIGKAATQTATARVATLNVNNGAVISDGRANGTNANVGHGGGNIYINDNSTVVVDGAETLIEGGSTGSCGGNIYATGANAVLTVKNGTFKPGSSDGNNQHNIRISALSTMNFLGGKVYGTDGMTVYNAGSAITVNRATLRLGGNATVLREDGGKLGLIHLTGDTGATPAKPAKLQVLNDWTGTAYFSHNIKNDTTTATTFAAHYAQCGTLSADYKTFTAGGTITGTLGYTATAATLAVTGANGVVSAAAAG